MNNDKYEIWNPVSDILDDIYFYESRYNGKDLTILLKKLDSANETLVINFKSVLGYRIINESGRIKTLYEIPTFNGFRFSIDSEFLRWFIEESGGIFDDLQLTHYVICNINNVIDVISSLPATGEWISTE